MRAALLALALLASGCVAPEPMDEEGRILLGYCPQWVEDPGQAPFSGSVDLGGEVREASVVVAGNASHGRHPLDVFRVRLDALELEGGTLRLRAALGENGTAGRNFYDYRSAGQPFQSVPVLVFRPGGNATGHDFDLVLAGISQQDAAEPGPVRLDWSFEPDAGGGRARADFRVTFLYRVCGAAV